MTYAFTETSCENNQGIAFIKKYKSGDDTYWQYWQSNPWKDQNRTPRTS